MGLSELAAFEAAYQALQPLSPASPAAGRRRKAVGIIVS
jgi:hypothetical protein